ncbi:MAG: hypothetical protein HY054_09985 [Proteobacteria bacterium]|nr:hypothetical protein [Pseudomonadota bacterium]
MGERDNSRPLPTPTFGQFALPLCYAVVALGFAWLALSLFLAATTFSQMGGVAGVQNSQPASWLGSFAAIGAIVSGGGALLTQVMKDRARAWLGVVILAAAVVALFLASSSLLLAASLLAIGGA